MTILSILTAITLLLICIGDVKTRTINHSYLLVLLVFVLSGWFWHSNFAMLPYSFLILLIGFVLHILRVLGAGDTKLLFVISLGVSPDNLSLLFFGIAFFSVALIFVYLIVAATKGMAYVKQRGLPFAVPISCAGALTMFLSNCCS